MNLSAFLEFMNGSPSGYHAVANLVSLLEEAGYAHLPESDGWDVVPGGKYYLTRGGTTVLAFRIPETVTGGFRMSASHSDRPTFKVKENAALVGTYTRLAVERYGGMLIAPWLDRPLSIAGRVMVETEDGARPVLVNIDKDLLMIPNVAIHMNRQANEGYKWNPAVDTLPLVGGKESGSKLDALLEKEAGGKILGHDLFLYNRDTAKVWGMEDDFVSAQALADVQGAASMILADTLSRICEGLKLDLRRMLAKSLMVSADNGHALHPNHPELADPTNAPVLGGGVVLKFNANQRYCTDGFTAALWRSICGKTGVKVQTYCNRADIAGGSTLGNISLGHVSVPTVDIGLPQLAMHSCYETAAVTDLEGLVSAMTTFYGNPLEILADGGYRMG